MVPILSALIYLLLSIMSVFLVCLVLIQRGKGGGLAGAFGGSAAGSSAFGSKAGDVFTRVTMVSAGIWIVLNMVLVVLSNQRTSAWTDDSIPGSASKAAFTPDPDKNATGTKAPAPTSVPPAGAAASPFDAMAPANPNTVAPSPITGGTPKATPATTTAPGGPATPESAPVAPAPGAPATTLPPAFPGSTVPGGAGTAKP